MSPIFRDYIRSLQLEEINFNDESEIVELPEMLLERSAAFHSQPDAFPELLDKLHRTFFVLIKHFKIFTDRMKHLLVMNKTFQE